MLRRDLVNGAGRAGVARDGMRSTLPFDVRPGETALVNARVLAPDSTGSNGGSAIPRPECLSREWWHFQTVLHWFH